MFKHKSYQKSISYFENELSESFGIYIREFWNSSLKMPVNWEFSQSSGGTFLNLSDNLHNLSDNLQTDNLYW